MSYYVYLHWDHRHILGLWWVNPDMWSLFCKEGSEWWVTSPLTPWLCCPELCSLCTQALLTLFWVLDHAKLILYTCSFLCLACFPKSFWLSPHLLGLRINVPTSLRPFFFFLNFAVSFSVYSPLGTSFYSFIRSLAVITFLCYLTWGMIAPCHHWPKSSVRTDYVSYVITSTQYSAWHMGNNGGEWNGPQALVPEPGLKTQLFSLWAV